MKYKKYSYIVVLILMLVVGVNRTYAVETTINTQKENNNIVLMADTTTNQSVTCEGLFGDKDDPESINYLIHEILMYPKIIVPILVIILGMLDLGKAVIASKPDEMKKAQNTFIKRVLIGLVIFFVPVVLDIFMYFADLVWEGFEMCGI